MGTLNLLMQPFVAIASELALPLPGSADRCSRTLPQLAAIGYLLLPTSPALAHARVRHMCCPNKGSTRVSEHICHTHQPHTHLQAHQYERTLPQTAEDNEVTQILVVVSHKLICPIWVQAVRGAIMKEETFYLAIQVNPFLHIRRASLNFKTRYMHGGKKKKEPYLWPR